MSIIKTFYTTDVHILPDGVRTVGVQPLAVRVGPGSGDSTTDHQPVVEGCDGQVPPGGRQVGDGSVTRLVYASSLMP